MHRIKVKNRWAVLLACAALAACTAWAAAPGRAATLADGRGYEMVSQPDKNGGDVLPASQRLRVAADGSAATFMSVVASADPVGTGTVEEFLSERTGAPGTRGWSAHAISPPQPAMNYAIIFRALETAYQGEMSSDLSTGVVRAWSPLTANPNVATATNLYVRRDLRQAGVGTYQLVTECPLCTSPLAPGTYFFASPGYVGASSDFQHMLFESTLPLATGGGGASHLYEWDHGVVRLAGVLPDGTPAGGSTAGGYKALGQIGTRLAERSISSDGSKIFFTDLTTHKLYMRANGTQTVQLNASERTDCAGDPTCGGDGVPDPAPDPSGPQPAQYWDASGDGTRVFFTSQEVLTDDASSGDTNLYMYDTTKPAGDPHHLTYLNVNSNPANAIDSVSAVIGASNDGSTIYFITAGQLVPGGPALNERGIFAWHDGVVSFVSPLPILDIPALDRSSANTKQAQVAANGDLLFGMHSLTGPTGYDQRGCDVSVGGFGACRELYLYHLATHTLQCVSCNPSGAPPVSDATVYDGQTGGAPSAINQETRAIADDGSRVFFSTADALVPEDVDGVSDAYEFDASTGGVHLLSSGTDGSPSYFVNATPDGHDAFFFTRERLVGWDVDQNYDLYDARIGGGFPGPTPAQVPCAGDRCQGGVTAPPDDLEPGSATFVGKGNVAAPRPGRKTHKALRCKKGTVKKRVRGRVRCVKRHGARRARGAGRTASRRAAR